MDDEIPCNLCARSMNRINLLDHHRTCFVCDDCAIKIYYGRKQKDLSKCFLCEESVSNTICFPTSISGDLKIMCGLCINRHSKYYEKRSFVSADNPIEGTLTDLVAKYKTNILPIMISMDGTKISTDIQSLILYPITNKKRSHYKRLILPRSKILITYLLDLTQDIIDASSVSLYLDKNKLAPLYYTNNNRYVIITKIIIL
jgi:hypothetical protein